MTIHRLTTAALIVLGVVSSPLGIHAQTAAPVGPPSAYPNLAITSGSIDPNVTQDNIASTICVTGYTKTVRPPVSVTEPIKVQQIAQYGYADTDLRDYEEDHLIPLEIGGNPSDPANLWPEPYAEPFGARSKDKVENYLHEQVCSGAMALADAQAAVQTDWAAVFQQMPGARQQTAVEGDPGPDASGAAAAANPPSVAAAAAQAAPVRAAATEGHTYYASTFRTARNIYCDNDPEWRSLSKTYLASFPSLAAAQAALPGYALHRPC